MKLRVLEDVINVQSHTAEDTMTKLPIVYFITCISRLGAWSLSEFVVSSMKEDKTRVVIAIQIGNICQKNSQASRPESDGQFSIANAGI